MARLDKSNLSTLKQLVDSSKHPWLLAAFRKSKSEAPAQMLEGAIGYFDWRLHGQVSRLVRSNALRAGTITMIPSRRLLGESNLLVFTVEDEKLQSQEVKQIVDSLKKLQVEEICLVESTWPEPFASKLRSVLKKDNISVTALEDAI